MLQSLHRQNEKKKKTIYTCSGSTATVLFSWLIICFVSTEKEKRHCTPGQPSPRQVEPPAHWSPDSNYASESASREGDCKNTVHLFSQVGQVAALLHQSPTSLRDWLIQSASTTKKKRCQCTQCPCTQWLIYMKTKKKQSRMTICLCAGGLDQGNKSLQTTWLTVCQLAALTKRVIS